MVSRRDDISLRNKLGIDRTGFPEQLRNVDVTEEFIILFSESPDIN